MERCIVRDDHYVPDLQNAHINTKPLVEELMRRLARTPISESDTRKDVYPALRHVRYQVIYDYLDSVASDASLDEPADDDLVCRYLSPEKFMWLLEQRSIYFSRPASFDDDHDCALHEDHNLAVEENLLDLLGRSFGMPTMSDDKLAFFHQMVLREWAGYERSRRQDWLISSWTRITEQDDDKLLLHKYAGGRYGVGITARYGELKRVLQDQLARFDRDGRLRCGLVNYDKTRVKALPFNKRRGFKGEHEVRFAFRSPGNYIQADVKDWMPDLFNLRLSADSPDHHHGVVRSLWVAAGGDLAGIHVS